MDRDDLSSDSDSDDDILYLNTSHDENDMAVCVNECCEDENVDEEDGEEEEEEEAEEEDSMFTESDSHVKHDEGAELEMTQEEKRIMYQTVVSGDIDTLDDLLDMPGADIRMSWFGENLLMAAIRAEEQDMAEFLIDNDVDVNFETTIFEIERKPKKKRVNYYSVNCRQMAYDRGMADLVEMVDQRNGLLWSFVKPRERERRMKKSADDKRRERNAAIIDSVESASTAGSGSSDSRAGDDVTVGEPSLSEVEGRAGVGLSGDKNDLDDGSLQIANDESVRRTDSSRRRLSRRETSQCYSTATAHSDDDLEPEVTRLTTPYRPCHFKYTKTSIFRARANANSAAQKDKRRTMPPRCRCVGSYMAECRLWEPIP